MNDAASTHPLPGVGDANVFPILNGAIWLDHAAVAPLPAPTANAMRRYLDAWERFGYQAWGHDAAIKVRRLAAILIGAAGEDEIAILPNTSSGLANVAKGLQLSRGDNVVLPEIEFPANRFVWEDLAQDGVNITLVPARDNLLVEDDDVIAAMRTQFTPGSTNVLAISHVQFSTGQRHDIARLAQVAHELNGLICVDAIQSIGQMALNVEQSNIDFASADGHKWMLGPEGAAVFYCRRKHLSRLRPTVVGWLNMIDSASYSADHMIFREDARKFEAGIWNVGGVIGLAASLELLLAAGVDRIESRIADLTALLREGAARAGYEVVGGPSGKRGSGIVALLTPEHGPQPDAAARFLEARGIRTAVRRDLLRLSPHYYNTVDQMNRTVEALRESIR